jgi:hypothetical protein
VGGPTLLGARRTHDQVSRAVAREALRRARDALPAYSAVRSRNGYTQHQLFAVLALETFLSTDDRGIAQFLTDSAEIRADLGLGAVPHYPTLCDAAGRLPKKGRSCASSCAPPRPRPDRREAEGSRRVYGPRWRAESASSRHHRRPGRALGARSDAARERECQLRVLTRNPMPLAAHE